jgi:hypothetical protein
MTCFGPERAEIPLLGLSARIVGGPVPRYESTDADHAYHYGQ